MKKIHHENIKNNPEEKVNSKQPVCFFWSILINFQNQLIHKSQSINDKAWRLKHSWKAQQPSMRAAFYAGTGELENVYKQTNLKFHLKFVWI